MKTINDNEVAVASRNIGLVDALDRVLDKGAVVDGDIYLSVAGIELVYLKLKLLLASVATVEKFSSPHATGSPGCEAGEGYAEKTQSAQTQKSVVRGEDITLRPLSARVLNDDELPPVINKPPSGKIEVDPKKVEQGLAKLVLTIVELLRNVMERSALRRVELGTLSEREIDALGEAFMRLYEKMKELKDVFGLKDSDLNLDLGPLGELI